MYSSCVSSHIIKHKHSNVHLSDRMAGWSLQFQANKIILLSCHRITTSPNSLLSLSNFPCRGYIYYNQLPFIVFPVAPPYCHGSVHLAGEKGEGGQRLLLVSESCGNACSISPNVILVSEILNNAPEYKSNRPLSAQAQ